MVRFVYAKSFDEVFIIWNLEKGTAMLRDQYNNEQIIFINDPELGNYVYTQGSFYTGPDMEQFQQKLVAGDNIEIKNDVISAIQPEIPKVPKLYDFALWLRKFAGRGSNAIAFFGIDGNNKITESVFRSSQRNFLLQVGTMKYATDENKNPIKQYYKGTVNRESIMQGLETRGRYYRLFIYLPVICNYYAKDYTLYAEDSGFDTNKSLKGYWEWYRQQCAEDQSLQLQYKIANEEFQPCYFHILNHMRVFSFYRTKDEWIELFDTYGDDIEITIYDPMGYNGHDNPAAPSSCQKHSAVLFAGFKNSQFGFFKRLIDTFDMRREPSTRSSNSTATYTMATKAFDIKPLYNVYCKPLEKIWHMEPISDDIVKCKRHMLEIQHHVDQYGCPYVLRKSYRIFGEDQRFLLENKNNFLNNWNRLKFPRYHWAQGRRLFSTLQHVDLMNQFFDTPLNRLRFYISMYSSKHNPNFLIKRRIHSRMFVYPQSAIWGKYVYPYIGSKNSIKNGGFYSNERIIDGNIVNRLLSNDWLLLQLFKFNSTNYDLSKNYGVRRKKSSTRRRLYRNLKTEKMVYSYKPIIDKFSLLNDAAGEYRYNYIFRGILRENVNDGCSWDFNVNNEPHRSSNCPSWIPKKGHKHKFVNIIIGNIVPTGTSRSIRIKCNNINNHTVSYQKVWYASKLYEYKITLTPNYKYGGGGLKIYTYAKPDVTSSKPGTLVYGTHGTYLTEEPLEEYQNITIKRVRTLDPREIKEQF